METKGRIQQITLISILVVALGLLGFNCKAEKQKENEEPSISVTLYDKDIAEVKSLLSGRWELLNGHYAGVLCEFENTFITFNGDKYIWSEDGQDEPGELNWRKKDTGLGYEAWLMDAFYATHPSFPMEISGDTLYIQEITSSRYKYTLIRRKK